MDDIEIELLISKLDENNLLSRLKGINNLQRFREFKKKAKKQILVAMKEATNGIPFNKLLKMNSKKLILSRLKVLCICIALNTELGFYNTKQDFVGFSKVNHNESLSYLNDNYMVPFWSIGDNNERFIEGIEF